MATAGAALRCRLARYLQGRLRHVQGEQARPWLRRHAWRWQWRLYQAVAAAAGAVPAAAADGPASFCTAGGYLHWR
mgnify:CR=1 FL=1